MYCLHLTRKKGVNPRVIFDTRKAIRDQLVRYYIIVQHIINICII